MDLKDWQKTVDAWISTIGVRYFDPLTNTLILNEEVGEFSSLIARKFGEQSFKNETEAAHVNDAIKDELADVLFVTICLANQLNIDLNEVLRHNIEKKTLRDSDRHQNNDKIKS